MTTGDRKTFTEILQGVYALYRADLSVGVIEIWWKALIAFDVAAVREAFGRHVVNPDSGQFLPKPADVVKMLGGSTLDSALQAWSKFEHAVSHVGNYATVAFDDPLIHRVVDEMGGWVHLCLSKEKDWPFRMTEFLNRYRGYKMRGETPAYPRTLIGTHDGENIPRGFAPQPLTMIGEERLVLAVVKGGVDGTAKSPVSIASVAIPALEAKVSR